MLTPSSLFLTLFLGLSFFSVADAVDVWIQPTSDTVGVPHKFVVAAGTSVAVFLAMVAHHYQFLADDIILFFGGQAVKDTGTVGEVPGFQHGFVMNMYVRGLVGFQMARQLHDHWWDRVQNIDVGAPDPNDSTVNPRMPTAEEKMYMLVCAVILTEDIHGVIPVVSPCPGGENYYANVIIAIMWYYEHRGWRNGLQETFMEAVYNDM